MWNRGSSLATMALACVWLAALSACEAMKSEGQTNREYRRALVEELCAPGEFYSECWWVGSVGCHEEMPFWVAQCLGGSPYERVQPSAGLRKSMLECLFHYHFTFVGSAMAVLPETEECLDAKRWKHIPPGDRDDFARYYQRREEWRRQQANPQQSVPATTDTPLEPSPEPSPGAVPDEAPAL